MCNCPLEVPGEGALMLPSANFIMKDFIFTSKNNLDIRQNKPPQDTKYKCNFYSGILSCKLEWGGNGFIMPSSAVKVLFIK